MSTVNNPPQDEAPIITAATGKPHAGLTGLHMAITELEQMVENGGADNHTDGICEALARLQDLYADVLGGMFPDGATDIVAHIENAQRYKYIESHLIVRRSAGKNYLVGVAIPKNYQPTPMNFGACIDKLRAVVILDETIGTLAQIEAEINA